MQPPISQERTVPEPSPERRAPPTDQRRREEHARLRAVVISLGVGAAILVAKFWAFQLTGSTAVLSDALESIVNVLAATFAIGSILFARRPADRNHPYGHGKIEFISAVFEGGLIAFAAFVLLFQSIRGLVQGVELRELDLGLGVVLAAGAVNALLGWYLVRTGTRLRSFTLIADGRHVLSDFWTSLGVGVGLLLVLLTGIVWLDPLVAGLVAVRLGVTGFRLVRTATGGLLDEEDPEVVARLVQAMEKEAFPGMIRVHSLRAIRLGRFHHIDVHVVVPEYWETLRAHEAGDHYAARVMGRSGLEGEIEVHADPCWRQYCETCDLEGCPVRTQPFRSRPPLTIDEAVRPDPPIVPTP
jgi:cation diffusion facilitator family transporter